MKKLSLIAGMLLIAATASAQFANSNSKSGSKSVDTDNYNRITFSWNPQTFDYDYKGVDNLTLNGLSLGYTAGISLSKQYPMFIELGARVNYAFKTQDYFEGSYGTDDDEYTEEMIDAIFNKHNTTDTYVNIAVPVNFAYKFKVGKDFAITPYLGVVLKANIISLTSYDFELTDDALDAGVEKAEWDWDTKDYFSKKDVGKDYTWNRFQIGWNIGAGFDYKKFYFGLSYGTDFMQIAKRTSTSNYAITLGVNF